MVTLAALAQGFGPGWSGEEVCQLALQSLRTQFVEARTGQDLMVVLRRGLLVANTAVHERALSYQAVSDIGVWLTAVAISGGRCVVAQVGGGKLYVHSKAAGLQKLQPVLLPRERDAYLGLAPDLELLTTAGEVECLHVANDAQLLLLNNQLGRLLPEDEITRTLARFSLQGAADRLLKPSQNKEFDGEAVLLLVQMPGVFQRSSQPVLRWVGLLVVVIVVALLVLNRDQWFDRSSSDQLGELSPVASPSITPTLTAIPATATEEFSTATAEPTAEQSPTATALAQASATPTFTSLPPSSTPSPSLTHTPTPQLPTATITPTPSPTIPAAPVAVGGRIVIVNTEGLGVSFREGPSTLFNRLLTLRDGDQLAVIAGPEPGLEGEEHLTWWQLRTDDGVEGWAVARFLQGVALP